MACEVEIFGRKYVLKSEADDEQIKRVAFFVDARMREVSKSLKTASDLQVAVLAALDIASDLLSAEAAKDSAAAEVDRKLGQMVQRIEELVVC